MRILLVITDSKIGGVTTAAVNFCNELIKRGEEVVLLDMSGDYLCANSLNQNVIYGKLAGKAKYWNLQADKLKLTKGIKKCWLAFIGVVKKLTIQSGLWYRIIFKKYKEFGAFDVAIAFRQCAPCYSFVLNKVVAKRKVGFVHGDYKGMGNIKSWQKYMTRFYRIAYVSNAIKNGFIKAFPELSNNATTIYNMLNVDYIIDQSKQECKAFFEPDKIKIVTVSRVENNQKGTDRIATVCKKLKEEGIVNFAWYLVGDGPDFELCKKQAECLGVTDVLFLLGQQSNPYPYLRMADFSVLSSRTEAFGLVVVESLILQKPVVACEYPALKEILIDGTTGLVVEQDEEALYLAVRKMIEDDMLRERLKVNCSEYMYSNDIAYRQFLEAIN